MSDYFHSVRLINHRCKGCVSCTRRCPTEAIRIRGGKAWITESRCIDCGECIRCCPNHAKTAVTDGLEDLSRFRFNVALPAPSLYAQFGLDIPIDKILAAMIELGFQEVFEVALGAEIVSHATKEYLADADIKRPAISSACPAVVRLIQVEFPELIGHLAPIDAPVEVAARIARAEYSAKYQVSPTDIGIWFIAPCPAKMTAVKQPIGGGVSNIDGVIAMASIYGELLKVIPAIKTGAAYSKATWQGIGWAVAGGETTALATGGSTLVVHEIHHVREVLEQIVLGRLKKIDYIETLACAGGCIGGPLTVENRFVAEHCMRQRARKMQQSAQPAAQWLEQYKEHESSAVKRLAIEPRPILRLDEDIVTAMHKVELMEKTLDRLPGLDCGSCGSPNCKALAEDIVQGTASETDCVFKLRERVRDLAKEMIDLSEKLPPPLEKEDEQ